MAFTIKAPPTPFQKVSQGEILASPELAKVRRDSADSEKHWGLGIARITEVDYEAHLATLKVVMGAADDSERPVIDLTAPSAGSRHYLGAMPQVGDMCVVGWMVSETLKGSSKVPIILSWLASTSKLGREWHTSAPHDEREMSLTHGRAQDVLGKYVPVVRHKLRHMNPGDIVASSSSGSDMVLDQSVTLANRRGNEFRLRDQDQAAVTRALQRFDALAGVRAYHGMVQRDAMKLPRNLVSDGKDWADPIQALNGEPVSTTMMSPSTDPKGFLTPARVLGKSIDPDTDELSSGGLEVSSNIDPYRFLRLGGFISDLGFVSLPDPHASAVYGGKDIVRVASGSNVNATLDPTLPTLTEYRVEVTHTTDGLLPVTEQTDGFDAERLPRSDPKSAGGNVNSPFIESVMGSVVGNDPYSEKGQEAYGLPIVAKIYGDDGSVAPSLDAVPLLVSESSDDRPIPITEHAATLFKLNPIDNTPSAWWSMNKKGQWKGTLSGPRSEASAELALAGGLTLALGGKLKLDLQGGIEFGTKSKQSLHLTSDSGPVMIYGGGPVQGVEGKAARNGAMDVADLPSVDIKAKQSARVSAERKVILKGRTVETQSKQVHIKNVAEMNVEASGGKINLKSETFDSVVTSKRKDEFTGPAFGLPTSGALHERTYTPMYPGLKCEDVTYTWGDRNELFLLGNHMTQILIGTATYQVLLGTMTLQAATSTINMGASGVVGVAGTGVMSLTATAGAATLTGLASASLIAAAGVATVRGSAGVVLSGPITGPDVGPIICAGSLEPLTGLPYLTWGMGAKAHLVSP